jgi:WD40 repeat protein
MGEVYRARDTKLDRNVAVKVLPDVLADNPERRARFEREAKVLAALNHPNIAVIYGLEDRAIVMEPVEGPTLAERIGSGPLPREVVDASSKLPRDISRDGRYLVTTTSGNISKTGLDIWVLPLFGDRKPFPYVQTEFQEDQPKFSPDGHWLAYRSNESKRSEIYVVSFPQPGEKWQVSTNGGQSPVWSRDTRELYYYGTNGKITAVEIKPAIPGSRQFKFGVPHPLFDARLATSDGQKFEVSRDGHFLLPLLVEQSASTPMTVVLNWPQMLKAK